MSGRPTIEVSFRGQLEYERALRRFGRELGNMENAHEAAAALVKAAAVDRVPVGKTGRLKDSIREAVTKRRGAVKAGGVAFKVRYAGPIHFGWPARNIVPQPFLYDALDKRRGEVLDVYWERVTELASRSGLDARKGARHGP